MMMVEGEGRLSGGGKGRNERSKKGGGGGDRFSPQVKNKQLGGGEGAKGKRRKAEAKEAKKAPFLLFAIAPRSKVSFNLLPSFRL